jgi:cell division protein FtsL
MKVAILISIIAGAIFISALQVVAARAETRRLFIQLQDLRKQHDDVDREWSQLLLEQETWSTDNRIEELARAKLKMVTPAAVQIRRVKL